MSNKESDGSQKHESTSNGKNGTESKRAEPSGRRDTMFDIRVFLVGTSALLMNQYEQEQMVSDLIFKKSRIADTETPLRPRAEKTIFRDAVGRIVIPNTSLMACLCQAGCDVPIKGKINLSKTGGRESKVPNFLSIRGGEHIPLLRSDGSPVTEADWKHDIRQGRLPTGQACAIVRAKFNDWALLVDFRVDLSKGAGLTLPIVEKLVATAGDSRGIGGFRKHFGRFTIAEGGWATMPVDTSAIVRPKAPAALMQMTASVPDAAG